MHPGRRKTLNDDTRMKELVTATFPDFNNSNFHENPLVGSRNKSFTSILCDGDYIREKFS